MSARAVEQLHRAAAAGDLTAVDAALDAGAAIDARDEYGDTALNEAAEAGQREIVRRLLERGANIENLGGADKTPLMNAAFAGHVDVAQELLEKGARVNNDLLSSMQAKVNIFREQAEDGFVTQAGVKAWERFLEYLGTARLRQDMGELVAGLRADDAETRADALRRIEMAAERNLDLSAATGALRSLLSSADADTRFAASKSLALEATRVSDWPTLSELLSADDADTKTGAMGVVVAAARDGVDITVLVPQLLPLLADVSTELRHDAPIALGYLATHKHDVRAALPQLNDTLVDPEPGVRQMGAWALYRIAKNVGNIDSTMGHLRRLLEDPNEDVRAMAQEAVRAGETAHGIS
ncbi:MAG: ankyrin repeat domain-containing protein [Chloroflexi bacterium]|nr:ankyrin repeat domain-containing protein [Chloroflexota bacterium]